MLFCRMELELLNLTNLLTVTRIYCYYCCWWSFTGEYTSSLLGLGGPSVDFLTDKVTKFHSELDIGLVTGPVEVLRVGRCSIIWEWLDPVDPKEVDKILGNLSSAILDPCLPWLVKASWWVTSKQLLAVIRDSLGEGVVPQSSKDSSLLKRLSLDATLMENFSPVSNFPGQAGSMCCNPVYLSYATTQKSRLSRCPSLGMLFPARYDCPLPPIAFPKDPEDIRQYCLWPWGPSVEMEPIK